ncbi:hypothetical protein [Wukongibacter baidiensis]
MLNILIGFRYTERFDEIRKNIIDSFQRKGQSIQLAEKYNKFGITKFLSENKNYSVLILQEHIEMGTPLTIEYLDKLTDEFPNLNVIVILDNKHYKSQLIKQIFNLRIYNCIFEKDAEIEDIVKLVLKGRTKKEAKFYYGINDIDDDLNHEDINNILSKVEMDSIIEYLMNSSEDELFNNYEYITQKYDEKQNIYIIMNLPNDLKEKLSDNDKYIFYFAIKNSYMSSQEADDEDVSHSKVSSRKEKILLKEKIVYRTPKSAKLKHVTIGVGGISNASGTTHTALGIGMFLHRNKNKVAVVDMSQSNAINNLSVHGKEKDNNCFRYMNLDFYNKSNDIFYEIKQQDYNFIIFDYGMLKRFDKAKGCVVKEESYDEMFRMNHQILCLNGSLWKWQDIIYYRCDDFASIEPNIARWKLVLNFTVSRQYKKLYSEIKNTTVIDNIYKAPIYNPFEPNEEYESFMSELLFDIFPCQSKPNKKFNPLGFFKK